MKKIVYLAMLAVIAMGLSSCEKIKSLADVKFDVTLTGDIDIAVEDVVKKSSAAPFDFEAYGYIDPYENDDIWEYEEEIKSFDVNGVVLRVVAIEDEMGNPLNGVVFLQGTYIKIYDSMAEITWNFASDFTLVEDFEVTLEDLEDHWKIIEGMLGRLSWIDIEMVGQCNTNNVYVTLQLGVSSKVTANPL
jgi:hypothetical protein